MSLRILFKEGIFISSKGELNYQDVLDDFKNAKVIRVVTYNLSKASRDDKLFEKLMNLGESVDIQLITNIPSRFNWYYTSNAGDFHRYKASTNIDAYLNKLDPNKFDCIQPFFNFNNHSKIIGTENIVYIGSANYSNESARNQETGIIIKDTEFIKELYKTFFDNLKENSIPYFDNEFNKLRLTIASLLTRIINHYNYIIEEMFIHNDNDDLVFIYDQETGFTKDDIDYLLADLYELEEVQKLIENVDIEEYDINDVMQDIQELYNDIKINYTQELIEDYSPFYEYVTFSEEEYVTQYIDENSLEAYDEYLEEYIDKAMYDFQDKLEEICNDASNDVIELKNQLELIIEKLSRINDLLAENSYRLVSKGIDNTK